MDSGETFADVNPFTNIASNSNNQKNNNVSNNKFEPNDMFYYNKSGEKYLLIFNHSTYMDSAHFGYERPNDRGGTEEDVLSLTGVFQKIGYTVLVYNNLVYDDIMKTIKYSKFHEKVSKQDHTSTTCLCIAILTHGDKDEKLYAADTSYNLRDITVKLENGHQGLVGKPKLFFIQACRGNNLDAGRSVQLDSAGSAMKIPTTADFLFFRSTVEGEGNKGYFSYRNAYGSFLIQELCKAVEANYEDKDIHYITTIVNRNVGYYYRTRTLDYEMDNKKQMPEVRHTLTKLFKF